MPDDEKKVDEAGYKAFKAIQDKVDALELKVNDPLLTAEFKKFKEEVKTDLKRIDTMESKHQYEKQVVVSSKTSDKLLRNNESYAFFKHLQHLTLQKAKPDSDYLKRKELTDNELTHFMGYKKSVDPDFENYDLTSGNPATYRKELMTTAAMSQGGGMTKAPTRMQGIFDENAVETSPVLNYARPSLDTSDTLEIPKQTGHSQGFFTSETELVKEQKGAAYTYEYQKYEPCSVILPVTHHLLENGVDGFINHLTLDLDLGLNTKINWSYLMGNGNKMPVGVYHEEGGFTVFNNEHISELQPDNVIRLATKPKGIYHSTAAFYSRRETMADLAVMKNDGKYVLRPFEDHLKPTVLGYPLRFFQDMPTVLEDKVPLLFGSLFHSYLAGRKKNSLALIIDFFTRKAERIVEYYVSTDAAGSPLVKEALYGLKMITTPV